MIPNAEKVVTMDLKEPGDGIYLVGETREELGGAHLWKVLGKPAQGEPPAAMHVSAAKETFQLMFEGDR